MRCGCKDYTGGRQSCSVTHPCTVQPLLRQVARMVPYSIVCTSNCLAMRAIAAFSSEASLHLRCCSSAPTGEGDRLCRRSFISLDIIERGTSACRKSTREQRNYTSTRSMRTSQAIAALSTLRFSCSPPLGRVSPRW